MEELGWVLMKLQKVLLHRSSRFDSSTTQIFYILRYSQEKSSKISDLKLFSVGALKKNRTNFIFPALGDNSLNQSQSGWGSSCETAVERTAHDRVVVGSDPVKCWAFFSSLSHQ